jgi:hypothetical protein
VRILRGLLIVGTGTYLLLLALFLVLRLLFGDGFWWLALANNFVPYYFLPLIAAVPLALLTRVRLLVAWSGLLALVALVWFAPFFVQSPRPVDGQTLRIVTFNIWGDNRRLADAENWLRTTDAGKRFLSLIRTTAYQICWIFTLTSSCNQKICAFGVTQSCRSIHS